MASSPGRSQRRPEADGGDVRNARRWPDRATTLTLARSLIDGCFAEAAALGMKPITVAVIDAGSIIDAVGITGDSSDKDEACAIAAIEAAGLAADPG